MTKNNKKRPKEEGLVELVNSSLFKHSELDLKPRFRLYFVADMESGKELTMPYPVIAHNDYAEHVLAYLNSLYSHLLSTSGKQGFSFQIDPVQFEKFKALSGVMDMYIRNPEYENTIVMNELDYIAERRKTLLNEFLNKGQIHDIIGATSTKGNTDRADGKITIYSPKYRPVCNNIGYMGMRMGLETKSNSMAWETYNLTNEFIDYLKKVHKVVVGAEYDSLQGNVPLQIHLEGMNGITDTERERKEQEIQELAKEYQSKTIDSKFMHAMFDRRKDGLFINHIDGSLMSYDFERLRQRLFSWRDKKEKVRAEDYKKVFKINMNDALEHNGFILPIYSSLDDQRKFDMHDLIEAYMGRYMI